MSELQTPYELRFLTNQWEWEDDLAVDTVEAAIAAARDALLKVVEEEAPELACVTLAKDGARLGVWDWVEGQAHWSRL